MEGFSLILALICEDARREESGKHILIGVICDGLFFRKLPANKRSLHLYVQGVAPTERFEIEFRLIRVGSSKVIRNGKGIFEYEGSEKDVRLPMDFSIDIGPLSFEAEGSYAVQLRWSERRWKTVSSFEVVVVSASAG